MDVTFVNPGVDYMIGRILDFQTEEEVGFWSDPLFYFYPQLDILPKARNGNQGAYSEGRRILIRI